MSTGGSSASTSQPSTSSGSNHYKTCADDSVDVFEVWSYLVKNWSTELKKNPQRIKQLVRQGIPAPVRALVWQLLSSADHDNARCLYAEFIRASSPHEKAIRRDVTRTFPGHKFFDESGRGQHSLFNVMKAYSLYDREVGYCQGSAFVVGMLLLLMPEEEAFAVLLKLMEDYRLRELYKPSMSELGLCLFQLECAVQRLFKMQSELEYELLLDKERHIDFYKLPKKIAATERRKVMCIGRKSLVAFS
ncbi:TBC domain protein [Trichuris suis]|nr:TBC domain protein [Trichuris suis]